jgi:hypothetical protein
MRGIMQLKYEPESVTISEKNRALGWVEDQRLIQEMQDDGWIPKKFRITSSGLSIEFNFVGKEARRFEYIIYQDGGSAETFVGCVNTDLSKDKWEVVFAFRAGFKGADPLGTYTRIIARRDIDQQDRRQFKYHFAYRNPRQMKAAKTKTWQRICSLPAHAGWQDEYAYDLFKEVL